MQLSKEIFERLGAFIEIQSVEGQCAENSRAVEFTTEILSLAGFEIRVEGVDELEQPVIVAHRAGERRENKLVIYGHYDVAPVTEQEQWVIPDPFKLTRLDGRLYGRGVADNKGTLLARLSAVLDLHRKGKALPDILWLIQGKEEVAKCCDLTAEIFCREVANYPAPVFLDETGFNDMDNEQSIAFLWSKSAEVPSSTRALSAQALIGADRIENRHLNKFCGGENCPFLSSLPSDALYVGFGPGDRMHNIHRQNESLSESLLAQHHKQFSAFVNQYELA